MKFDHYSLLRGRYMVAAARIERCGVPIDQLSLNTLRENWPKVIKKLVRRMDAEYGCFDGVSFRTYRWLRYLAINKIPWPTLPSGRLALDKDTFRDMGHIYPAVAKMQQLRHALSEMRLERLAVGPDGRNRTLLSAFRARTGRNQPKNSEAIFGPAIWLRSLIKPQMGRSVVYLDYAQQEFGIAAALSGDANMMAAYRSGDPYLEFAKQAGLAPADATKASHKPVRDRCKECVLGVQYSMSAIGLGLRILQPTPDAEALIQLHHGAFPTFWKWSDSIVEYAMIHSHLRTVFDWRIRVTADANPRSLRNFPVQANGAEMLRLACCLATERGVNVCVPVHDALLIEAATEDIDHAVSVAREAMAEASRIVLDGFEIKTDYAPEKLIHHPNRYRPDRGAEMWKTVWEIIGELDPMLRVIAEACQ